MRQALEGKEERLHEQPEGLVMVRINPNTGQSAPASDPDAVFEVFRTATAPRSVSGDANAALAPEVETSGEIIAEKLF